MDAVFEDFGCAFDDAKKGLVGCKFGVVGSEKVGGTAAVVEVVAAVYNWFVAEVGWIAAVVEIAAAIKVVAVAFVPRCRGYRLHCLARPVGLLVARNVWGGYSVE